MSSITMRQMIDAGTHFGHQTRRWDPKMKPYILTERNGIYIINLQKTLDEINNSYDFVKDVVAAGGNILFVGTKRQAQETIAEQAQRVGMPYVNHRWLGGMLTNFSTVSKRVGRLKELEVILNDEQERARYTKKELLLLEREKNKLEKSLGGIQNMNKLPSAIWVADTVKEHLAVAEAKKLGIPVVAIVDTNSNPDDANYVIPGNDDAIRSVELLTSVIADAAAEGLLARGSKSDKSSNGSEAEPVAQWERDLLENPDENPVSDSKTSDSEKDQIVNSDSTDTSAEDSVSTAEPKNS